MSDVRKKIFNIKKSKSYINYNNYHSNNILSITQVSRRELMHSKFIAWLLNMHVGHGLGSFPVEQFVKCLEFVKDRQENVDSRIDLDVINRFYDDEFITDVKVYTEYKYIDILVLVFTKDKTLPILIENKVDSDENNNQTNRYYNNEELEFQNRDEYYDPIYVYLYPKYNDGKPQNKAYLRMTYQDLVDYVIEPSYFKCEIETIKNNIKTYLQCLSYSNDNEKGKYIMAVSSEEKDIISDFIRENKELLYLVFDELKDDNNKDLIDKMTTTVRDYTKYRFNNETYVKRQLVLAVVKKYCIDNPNITFEELSKVFPDNLAGSHGVVKLKDYLIEKYQNQKDNYYDRYCDKEPITLSNGDVVLVSSQWGKDNIKLFIEKAKSLGYDIEEI